MNFNSIILKFIFNNNIFIKNGINIKLAKLITPLDIKFLMKYTNKKPITKKSKNKIYVNIFPLDKIIMTEKVEKSNKNNSFLLKKCFIIFILSLSYIFCPYISNKF
jgi:hypothetical protein